MLKHIKYAISTILILVIISFISSNIKSYAISLDTDGIYAISISNDLTMGSDYVPHTGLIEKNGDYYYLTLTFGSELANLRISQVDGKTIGYEKSIDGSNTTYTYTFSENTIGNDLNFTATVAAMGRDVSFILSPDLSSAKKTGEYTSTFERPAEYVPDITTSAGSNYMVEKGSIFTIPSSSATLGSEECNVTTSITYNDEEVSKDNDNQFTVNNIGEYKLIYKATTSKYKTNFGNDSYSIYEVTITSKVGVTSLAKYDDPYNILGSNVSLQASEVTEGSIYNLAQEAMKNIADKYKVVDISFFDSNGNFITLSDNIILKIMPDDTFDRTKTNVYYMDNDGSLTKISTNPYGRYVSIETNKTGTYILSYGGISFHMPMWGYILIFISAVVVLGLIIFLIIFLLRKHKKNNSINKKIE